MPELPPGIITKAWAWLVRKNEKAFAGIEPHSSVVSLPATVKEPVADMTADAPVELATAGPQ